MCDEHRQGKGKNKRTFQGGSDFDKLQKAVKEKRQRYLCQQPEKYRLQQNLTLTVSPCEAVKKNTGRIIYRSTGEKKAVTYTYRQKTIEGLQRTFADALHGVTSDAEFEKFNRKNNLIVVANGAHCTEDVHISNKSAFMFCIEKRRNTVPDFTFNDSKSKSSETDSRQSSSYFPKPAGGFNASFSKLKNNLSTHSSKLENLPNDPVSSFLPHGLLKFYRGSVSGDRYSLCRKDVQTQAIAEKIGKIFRHTVKGIEGFGAFPRIIPSFLVQKKGTDQFYSIEPKIPKGIYRKFINNDGQPTTLGQSCDIGQKCLAFVHWSMLFTSGKFLLCDVQGTEEALTDLQVASADSELFGAGNMGEDVFKTFEASHKCNPYCKLLNLDKKDAICKDHEIAALRKMGITATDVMDNMLGDLTAIMRGTKPCKRMDLFKKGRLSQRNLPAPPADALTDVITSKLIKVFGPHKSKDVLLVLVPEVRDRIKAMTATNKEGKKVVGQEEEEKSVQFRQEEHRSQPEEVPRTSKTEYKDNVSGALLSHMKRQTMLMEQLVKNQYPPQPYYWGGLNYSLYGNVAMAGAHQHPLAGHPQMPILGEQPHSMVGQRQIPLPGVHQLSGQPQIPLPFTYPPHSLVGHRQIPLVAPYQHSLVGHRQIPVEVPHQHSLGGHSQLVAAQQHPSAGHPHIQLEGLPQVSLAGHPLIAPHQVLPDAQNINQQLPLPDAHSNSKRADS